ncbi:MAG: chemosensory pili system protein ChpA (sensor histidine kinase/response regulator) [Planctomycetaceae bacterium]|jgi:chemosensory pili system protein ChpA (sensor histidine kinase/response regulator)
MPQPVSRAILVSFIDELREATPAVRAVFAAASNGSPNMDDFQEACRRVHSLTGSSALLRLSVTNEVAAQLEWALEEVGTREDVFDAARTEFVNRFCALFDEHADALLDNTVETAPVVTEAVTLARRITGEEEIGDQSAVGEALERVGYEATPDVTSATEETAAENAAESNYDVDMLDMDQLDAFTAEAEEHVQEVALLLTEVAKDPSNTEPLAEVRRRIHSLKGAASTTGFNDVAHLSHRLEDLLQRQLDGELESSATTIELSQTTVDVLEELVQGLDHAEACEVLYRRFDDLLGKVVVSESGTDDQPADESDTIDELATAEDTTPRTISLINEFRPTAEQLAELESDINDRDRISPELMEVFNEEAEDHLRNIYACFAQLEKDLENREVIQSVRRSAHTLKGAAGAVGLRVVTQLAHRMEDMLDRLHEGGLSLNQHLLTLLFSTADALQDLVNGEFNRELMHTTIADLYAEYGFRLSDREDAFTGSTFAEVVEETGLVDEAAGEVAESTDEPVGTINEVNESSVLDLDALGEAAGVTLDGSGFGVTPLKVGAQGGNANDEDNASTTAKKQPQRPARDDANSGQALRVPVARLDALTRLVGELIINRTAFEQRMSDVGHFVEEMQLSIERLRNVGSQLESKYAVNLLGGRKGIGEGASLTDGLSRMQSKLDEFDDLEMDRYTEFHLLARSLAESSTDLSTVGLEFRNLIGDFDQLLTRQGRLSRDTQDRLMRIRMVPLATVATRLHRTVRVVSNQQNKKIDLEIRGEYVELDKFVLEEMADPLLHLLRNAADHGIEPSADRQAAGKSERGTIGVEAFYQGTQVVIEISDDGRGLDLEAIREKAVSLEMYTALEAAELSDDELFPLIFQPGFSTAKELSEVSGRGVGMDIVRDKVNSLKGTVSVASEASKGTTFTIRLPMTLAVTRALLISDRQETFAIPMQAVQQILRLEKDQVDQLGTEPVIRVSGRTYPLVNLSDKLSLQGPPDESRSTIPVLIVSSGDQQIALAVEKILSGRDIVVKTLGNHLRQVDGLIGATLTGEGTVVPILDVAWMVGSDSNDRMTSRPTTAAPKKKRKNDTNTVMIVDDSVSVRRVMSNLIRSAGWSLIEAKDGVDALEVLQSSARKPDLFLLDIEMPRMDGYELLSSLRSHDAYRNIPVVMVTSRASEKHRPRRLSTSEPPTT